MQAVFLAHDRATLILFSLSHSSPGFAFQHFSFTVHRFVPNDFISYYIFLQPVLLCFSYGDCFQNKILSITLEKFLN